MSAIIEADSFIHIGNGKRSGIMPNIMSGLLLVPLAEFIIIVLDFSGKFTCAKTMNLLLLLLLLLPRDVR